jgi:hypothetical protein
MRSLDAWGGQPVYGVTLRNNSTVAISRIRHALPPRAKGFLSWFGPPGAREVTWGVIRTAGHSGGRPVSLAPGSDYTLEMRHTVRDFLLEFQFANGQTRRRLVQNAHEGMILPALEPHR